MSAEELANQAAERVRAVIKEAEDRAAEIIRDAEDRAREITREAEGEAAGIRERAEADVRERLDRARQVLADFGPPSTSESPPPPEAEAAVSLPASSQGSSARGATPEAAPGADEGAARLVAMKMALEGKGREEIESALAKRFGSADRAALLDDVLARASR